jgi:hypothetical protein
MIVKIKANKGWLFYDGFEKIHHEGISREQATKIEPNAIWCEDNSECEGSKCPEFIILYASKRGNEPYSLVTNQITYLLNDEGKTIERLN